MCAKGLANAVACLIVVGAVRADEVLYRYEGNVVPYDASEGWFINNPCDEACSEFLENGHFVLFWAEDSVGSGLAGYTKVIAGVGVPPPDPLGRMEVSVQLPLQQHNIRVRR